MLFFKVCIYVYVFHVENPTAMKPTMMFTMDFTEFLSSVLDELAYHFGHLDGMFQLF